jgi:hypothetical protein
MRCGAASTVKFAFFAVFTVLVFTIALLAAANPAGGLLELIRSKWSFARFLESGTLKIMFSFIQTIRYSTWELVVLWPHPFSDLRSVLGAFELDSIPLNCLSRRLTQRLRAHHFSFLLLGLSVLNFALYFVRLFFLKPAAIETMEDVKIKRQHWVVFFMIW